MFWTVHKDQALSGQEGRPLSSFSLDASYSEVEEGGANHGVLPLQDLQQAFL